MNYKQIKKLNPAEFKRCCGVKPETFEQMVKVIAAEKKTAIQAGKAKQIKYRRANINDFELLERIPHLLSFGNYLGD